MSRLDLLKKGSTANKTETTNRSDMMGVKTKKSQLREDDFNEDFSADDFENELADVAVDEYDLDEDDDKEVNVIEIDFDTDKSLEIDNSFIKDDSSDEEDNKSENSQTNSAITTDSKTTSLEKESSVDYSEDDIKLELEYSFDHREDLYNNYIKAIKDGGLEVSVSKIMLLDDIIRVSVTLSELKEQVGCEARVVSVFPRNIRTTESDANQYRYIVQFIGPNASETERVLSKYLLGYKYK